MSMHQMSVTLLTGLLMIAPLRCPPAWSWGSEGHQTIGAMADTLLAGTHAGQRMQELLLPGEILSTAAIWADCAKGFLYCHRALTPEMQTFVQTNPRHHNYHYTDVPFAVDHYVAGAVGTDQDDVVQIVSQAISVLRHTTAAANPHAQFIRICRWL